MTIGQITDKIPEWIRHLGHLKQIKYGVGYIGWDWASGSAYRKLELKLNFYFPNGEKRPCNIWLPNTVFIYDKELALDKTANITIGKFDEETTIKLRILYLIYRAYQWIEGIPEFDPQKSNKYINTKLVLDIDDAGYPDFKFL